jgi:hypothetical protein
MFSQKISMYSEDNYYDLFDTLYGVLLVWINERPEIIVEDMDTLKIYFIEFLLVHKERKNDYNEYFVVTYSDDIVDLFIKFKEICNSYGTHFLNEKGRTSDDLSEFILGNVSIHEKISESEIIDDDHANEYE